VPTCGPADRLPDVRAQIGDWETCFVVDEDGVVLGRLGRSALGRDDDVAAEEAMSDGPSTIRPSARLEKVVERMRAQDLTGLPVTTSDGRLVGLLVRADAEGAVGA
jgi:Mg/Co/Ni transporter MgtE